MKPLLNPNRLSRVFIVFALVLSMAVSLVAQVPQLINYQGRIAVAGTNFDGSGQFKFALVNGGSNTSTTATAIPANQGGSIFFVFITDGGSGYLTAPDVTIRASSGSGAVLEAVVTDGSVTAINVLDGGSGYPEVLTLTIAAPPTNIVHQSYWSNDGTSTAGSQPAAATTLNVTKGLYSVLLGDTALPNMAAIPASVFANTDVRLRVWFNDGTNGFQLLTPDQRIAAVGYAMVAGNVSDGAITSAKIASGAVGAAQLASGAAAANLSASNQGGVASGGIVLSASSNNTALTSAGYVKIGLLSQDGQGWKRLVSAPMTARRGCTQIWTGSQLLIWGGLQNPDNAVLGSGQRFNPTTGIWSAISATGAPTQRYGQSAIWTGTEMIVWGGYDGTNLLNAGGRYNPTTDTWTTLSGMGAPDARYLHTAVWTGSEMIVWGGSTISGDVNTGGRYNPLSNAWTALSTTGAPSARSSVTAVWTGSKMVVWGGKYSNTGGRYDPVLNTWAAITTAGAPTGRQEHSTVWTGTSMIVWGGYTATASLNTGGQYNPVADSWTPTSTTGAPLARNSQSVVWTGSEMILWGGQYGGIGYANDGGRYNPTDDSWVNLAGAGAPIQRAFQSVVWTGTDMLLFGGFNDVTNERNLFNDCHKYTPATPLYLYQRP